ncbi:MAG: DUF4124 domain-containing protein [Xanthomonadaceae bacterium]|nr:DUF4124 domain-containing protein [Xanthomonadaceae bacterium]MDE3073616.1 DUF4124 domain-containing protein [Pseudomonadota bacterium]
MPRLSALLLLALACIGLDLPAYASTVYKCSGRGGQLIYQDAPCARTQRQQTLQLPDTVAAPAPEPAATAPVVPDEPASTAGTTAPPHPVPRVPLTQLYRCVHAVDGSVYLSRYGHPQPFQAPLGMLGAFALPLAQVYGPPGGAGISAPEANRGRITSGLIAGDYVWVQDQCRPLSVPEICRALRDELEKSDHDLQHAFKSDQPPLQRRNDELRAQLTNC